MKVVSWTPRFSQLVFQNTACGDPIEISNGSWKPTSQVKIWDSPSESTEVVQQVQYKCNAGYEPEGEIPIVNCDHNTNSFVPDPPVCVLDKGESGVWS